MLLLWIVTLLNALLPQDAFLNSRLTLAGVPINLFDLFLPLGVVWAIFRSPPAAPGEKIHPLLPWLLGCFLLATFGGFIAAQTSGATPYEILFTARNFICLPVSVFIGYRLLSRPRAAKNFIFAQIIAGASVALLILTHFGQRVEDKTIIHGGINSLRIIAYIATYSGTGALFLMITVFAGIRIPMRRVMMPTALVLLLAMITIIGQFATLSRSEWVSDTLSMIVLFILLVPRARVPKALAQMVVTLLILFAALSAGVLLVNHVGEMNLGEYVSQKIQSLDPTNQGEGHAWDSRLPGSKREVEMGMESPIIGCGFGKQNSVERMEGVGAYGFQHDVWTSTFCQNGLLGLASMFLLIGGCFFVGRAMYKARTDQFTMAWGAFGATTGVCFFFFGLTTMSFNNERSAIPLGLVVGLTLRARAKQLAAIRQYQAEHGELPLEGVLYGDEQVPEYTMPESDDPEFGDLAGYGAYPA